MHSIMHFSANIHCKYLISISLPSELCRECEVVITKLSNRSANASPDSINCSKCRFASNCLLTSAIDGPIC
ncbi:hypothetical protein KSF78_0003558 [Schistosoma japonicum]|nr:hypothetical protein KSF78_0003558 [Schistosoma japonicum]